MNDTSPSHVTLPPPVMLGYKLRIPQPAARYYPYYGLQTSHIVEVCCFGHPVWMTGANAATCYGSEEAAIEAADTAVEVFQNEHERATAMFAYRAFPLLFGTAGPPHVLQPIALLGQDASQPQQLDDRHYSCLGYDLVEYSLDPREDPRSGFWPGCSPLSLGCNGMALELGTLVNCYCLIDQLSVASDSAIQFGVQQPEPGPYVIVEVWRRTSEL